MVACEERTLHRGRGDLEGLEEENVQESNNHDGEDDGIKPVQPYIMFLPFLVLLFPEEPLDLFSYLKVEDDSETYKPPVISKPNHPQQI